MLDSNTFLSEIAVQYPQTIPVFRKFKLDYCCGGARPLTEVCREKGLDEREVLANLEAALPKTASELSWQNRSSRELIEHIERNYHAKHRSDLALLVTLARKVEAVHGDNPEAPVGLAALLAEVSEELDEHMRKEEQVLFPWILREDPPRPIAPIRVLSDEHLAHAARLEQLRQACRGFELPLGACTSWRALYAGVSRFIDEVMEHIHLENNVLFPRAIS